MKSRSKRYKSSASSITSETSNLSDALVALQKFDPVKFDESIEVSVSLGVDPKQSSQAVRGTINLPHGSGKDIKVLVFTDNADEALAVGADFAGLDDMIKKVRGLGRI
jgi:large subunit ribosomal protein L1